MLEAPRSPGVVDLVAIVDGDSGTALSTAWLGGGTFATANLPPKKLAAAGAALALTLAIVHERGIVHGHVTADHVLLDSAGRVVLGGFAEAAAAGANAGPSAAATAIETTTDVSSVGDLILSKLPTEALPTLKLHAHAPDNEIVERLRAIAQRNRPRSDAPAVGPRAGRLADGDLRRRRSAWTDPARSPRPGPSGDSGTTSPRTRTRGSEVGGVHDVGTPVWLRSSCPRGCSGAGARRNRRSHRSRRVRRWRSRTLLGRSWRRRAAAVMTTPPTTVQEVTKVWPTAPPASTWVCQPLSAAGERRDIDGDGCPEEVTVESGTILVDDQRFDIGEANDAISIADWDCDGRDTAALVRHDTGEVYVFDAWAAADAPATARLVDRVEGRDIARCPRRRVWRAHRDQQRWHAYVAQPRRRGLPMSSHRTWMRPLNLTVVAAAAAWALWRMGAALPLPRGVARHEVDQWLREQGAPAATFAMARVGALVVAAYAARSRGCSGCWRR